MNRLIKIFLCCVCIALVSSPVVQAKRKQTYAMSLNVFRAVEQINGLVDEEKYQDAMVELDETLGWGRLSQYERAQLWYLKGTIVYKTKGEAASIPVFTQVLEYEGNIPEFLHQRVLKTLLQLNLVSEAYLTARDLGIKLIEVTEQPSADDWALLAQANYKLEDWAAALAAIEAARKIEQEAGKTPKENLLLLQNATYYELKQMDNMIITLEALIKYYPKSTYMLYLASIYGQTDRLDKQTVLMESLYEAGQLRDTSQLINLASLYMSEKVPIKAAELLHKALESGEIEGSQRNYEMLSQAWLLAAEIESSMQALAKAASLSDSGDLQLRLAYMHYDLAQWQEAESTARVAIDTGMTPERTGEAYLLIGMARFNTHSFDSAIAACEQAANFSGSRDLAQRWITYISREHEKYNSMLAIN